MSTECPKCQSRRFVSRGDHVLKSRGTVAVLEDVEFQRCPACEVTSVDIPDMDLLMCEMAPHRTARIWPPRFRFSGETWTPTGFPANCGAPMTEALTLLLEGAV